MDQIASVSIRDDTAEICFHFHAEERADAFQIFATDASKHSDVPHIQDIDDICSTFRHLASGFSIPLGAITSHVTKWRYRRSAMGVVRKKPVHGISPFLRTSNVQLVLYDINPIKKNRDLDMEQETDPCFVYSSFNLLHYPVIFHGT
jgi:hypothetical protein